jgi:hypothetical protein
MRTGMRSVLSLVVFLSGVAVVGCGGQSGEDGVGGPNCRCEDTAGAMYAIRPGAVPPACLPLPERQEFCVEPAASQGFNLRDFLSRSF